MKFGKAPQRERACGREWRTSAAFLDEAVVAPPPHEHDAPVERCLGIDRDDPRGMRFAGPLGTTPATVGNQFHDSRTRPDHRRVCKSIPRRPRAACAVHATSRSVVTTMNDLQDEILKRRLSKGYYSAWDSDLEQDDGQDEMFTREQLEKAVESASAYPLSPSSAVRYVLCSGCDGRRSRESRRERGQRKA